MIHNVLNNNEFLFCDNFEHRNVSKLSLFLYEQHYTLMAKNLDNEILSVVQEKFDDFSHLEKLLTNHEIFQISCPKDIFWMEGNFMVIPEAYFEKNQENIYGSFLEEPLNEFDFIESSCSFNTHILSSIPKDLKLLLSNFKDTNLIPGVCNFLTYLNGNLEVKKTQNKDLVYVCASKKYFWIAVFIENKLHLLNKFNLDNKESLLKYIYGITNQLGLAQNDFSLKFISASTSPETTQEWIDQYFLDGQITTPISNLNYLGETSKIKDAETLEVYWQSNF